MKRARLFSSLPAEAGARSLHPSLGSGLRHLRAVALRVAQEGIVNTREVLIAFCARYKGDFPHLTVSAHRRARRDVGGTGGTGGQCANLTDRTDLKAQAARRENPYAEDVNLIIRDCPLHNRSR